MRVGVQCLDQFLQTEGEARGALLAGEEEQGLDDRADAVVRDGERVVVGRVGTAAVDEGAQSLVQVEVDALDPVGEFLVGEAVAAAAWGRGGPR